MAFFPKKPSAVRLNELRSCDLVLRQEDPNDYMPITQRLWLRAAAVVRELGEDSWDEISIDDGGGALIISCLEYSIYVTLYAAYDKCELTCGKTAERVSFRFSTAAHLLKEINKIKCHY